MEGFRLDRRAKRGVHALTDVAQGLEDCPSLQGLFGGRDALAAFLRGVRMEVTPSHGYMWIDDSDGRLVAAMDYLRRGDERSIYLDLAHELVHVRQYRDGQDLFDEHHAYVDRPTELEAYRVSVAEARRLGFPEAEIAQYLHVPWVTTEEHVRLCRTLGVRFAHEGQGKG